MVTESRKPHLLRRKTSVRQERPKTLIVCEGEATEPNYFRAFRVADVEVVGAGCNTRSVVEEAVTRKTKKRRGYYASVWAVFDRDSFPPERIEQAFSLAEENGIKVAFSNEAFELWYLLHFEFRNTPMARHEYKSALSRHLGKEYKKNDVNMYELLKDKQEEIAIPNAEKLCNLRSDGCPLHTCNPYTDVYKLVDALNSAKSGKTDTAC